MIKIRALNTTVYGETLTGRPHDISVQKLPVTMKMWMQFNVMPCTLMGVFLSTEMVDEFN